MDLWIRSQNRKNLLKIRDICIDYHCGTRIICDYQPDFVGKEGEYFVILGEYKTKERALEILDEIQNILKPQIITKLGRTIGETCNGIVYREPDEIEIKEFSTYLYEMPKE